MLLERKLIELGGLRRDAQPPRVEHERASLEVLDVAIPADERLARPGDANRADDRDLAGIGFHQPGNAFAALDRGPLRIAELANRPQQVAGRRDGSRRSCAETGGD